MRCFYHGDAEAVAICRSCGHGICHDCCAEAGTGSACRNRCEADVEALNTMIQQNKSALTRAGATQKRAMVFGLAMGATFLWWGLQDWRNGGQLPFTIFIGIIFLLAGLSQLALARRSPAK